MNKIFIILIIQSLYSITRSQFNLYNTEEHRTVGSLHTNCLRHYSHKDWNFAESVEYCIDSMDSNDVMIEPFPNTINGNLTFDQLRQLNINTQDLISWSASIDLAERYQFYIEKQENSTISNEIFFNCTKPWFGSRCQYSFGLGSTYAFEDIVRKTFSKKFFSSPPYLVTNLTCYIYLKCDRGNSMMCLDWREICDGRIDCIDGGADEKECFILEINECNEDEYRCHNGLCIPKDFFHDKYPECLDKSDLKDGPSDYTKAGYVSIFGFEEHSCLSGYKQFQCGDGRCVADFDECLTKRHLLLYDSISQQGNLSYDCWSMIICLTKIYNQINGILCQKILETSNIHHKSQNCDPIIQFPIVPVLFGHVRFLYTMNNIFDIDHNLAFIPNYICYDSELCDFLQPTFHYGIYSCRESYGMVFNSTRIFRTWSSIISVVEPFFRKCSIRYKSENTSQELYANMYCCRNSSKCISKHHLVDHISDCYLNDDEEEYESSCLLNHAGRFKCDKENNTCYSSIVSRNICPPRYQLNFDEINIHHICDRDVQMLSVLIHGQNHTDETECEHYPCNNMYTRCDGFWSCPDGEDEENCTTNRHICPLKSLACVSPMNYSLICLSAHRINDKRIDCLGSADELHYCRQNIKHGNYYHGFRCWNGSECLGFVDLCNKRQDCKFNDDELFCGNYQESCEGCQYINCTNVTETLCHITILGGVTFSLKTVPKYPPSPKQRRIEHISQPQSQNLHSVVKVITQEPYDRTWPWRCNKGIYVSVWPGTNSSNYRCLCPPPYYGNLCQYQNQRVSLTAKVTLFDRKNVYALIFTLIGEDGDREEINSYHELILVSKRGCQPVQNIYLTYSTRPKNNSMNYSIHVDIYEKIHLEYLASWYFPVPFSFLPNNRMSIILAISNNEPYRPKFCTLKCRNGECMKYINKNKMFCRCHRGWSGTQCDIPIHCNDCSTDSMCIGMIHNRSICFCRIDRGGPRCLLPLSCPSQFCENNGSCFLVNDVLHAKGFVCNCTEEFTGTFCQIVKSRLEVSLDNLRFSSSIILFYIFNYIGGILRFEQMEQIVIPQQMKMFQKTTIIRLINKFQMIFINVDGNFYLIVLQQDEQENITTSVNPSQRCSFINELLNSSLVNLHQIRRMKYYPMICQIHLSLQCFFDDPYMCLCTIDRFANCLKLNSTPPICRHTIYCENGGRCLNDDSLCPESTICDCTDCYFGDRCQFYAKGIGLTLDDILRYEIQPNINLFNQPNFVKYCAILIIIMFLTGLINSTLTVLTFRMENSREVGCGLYLLASSVTSFLTVFMLSLKFCFLLFTQMNPTVNNSLVYGGCRSLEFILKVCLYTDSWLNASIALERLMTVKIGVSFNKLLSKRIARWTILFLPFVIMVSVIHEPIYRNLFEDKYEERRWCLFLYSRSLHTYHVLISLFHLLGPFSANLFSTIFIIIYTARQRRALQSKISYREHQWQQFMAHKHLIISSIILTILSTPRIIIAFLSGCVKASYNPQVYAAGYFISFVPSISIFIVFVMPSDFYKEQFKKSVKNGVNFIIHRNIN
ncbi:hypothetical protein I4U23_022344 [Adineta vaga]|nr:hypothetical protein I4U23_022344 [Adineta vaga]